MRFEPHFQIEKRLVYEQDLGETKLYLANPWIVPKSFSCKDLLVWLERKHKKMRELSKEHGRIVWREWKLLQNLKNGKGKPPRCEPFSLYMKPFTSLIVCIKTLAWKTSGKVPSSPFLKTEKPLGVPHLDCIGKGHFLGGGVLDFPPCTENPSFPFMPFLFLNKLISFQGVTR